MWKCKDVIDEQEYRVGLKAGKDGSRRFHLLDANTTFGEFDFVTPIVDDKELLRFRRYEEIISRYGTVSGVEIVVDAHGMWLTAHEADQLEDDVLDIDWHRGIAPAFAPK